MNNYEINDKQIGQRIYFARHDKHLSRHDLAQRTNLSVSYIGDIERGSRHCSLESLARICSALELSADYILFGKDANSEKLAIICDYLEHHLNELKRSLQNPHSLA